MSNTSDFVAKAKQLKNLFASNCFFQWTFFFPCARVDVNTKSHACVDVCAKLQFMHSIDHIKFQSLHDSFFKSFIIITIISTVVQEDERPLIG